ncbi:MAG: hypothetical protein H6577_14550 [Lewinellaceae bacterium]|nr:hypothetical protein [Saprospiraceae bacterium]MCB9339348.1 hypothetical protein [Lewinellaceae bacterium]
MKFSTYPLKAILIVLTLLFSFPSANAQFTINNVFGDLSECDTMTKGIFIVWWDKDFDLADKADELLDTMLSYRSVCLNDVGMMDPPNPMDGFYYNVYLHGSGFFSSFGWGNGQGTDSNGYPFLTLPTGLANDWPNTSHETFHVFQYNSNSPGFAYSGDSQWFIEASANWFAARQNPDANRRFVEAESLVRLPQVPFWLSYDNFPADYPQNWQRYVHQYALALHLYYLTEVAGVPEDVVTSGLYSGTNELPQEYMYNLIGADNYRQYFIDWATHMTNDFDFIPAIQAATNLNEWNTYADPDDDNEYIAIYENQGTGGWFSPGEDEGTHAWSFNTYKLINSQTKTYTFEVNGIPVGNYGDAAFFQGQVLVRNSDTGASFHDLNMMNNLDGSLSLDLTPQDTAVYFIIASMPEVFRDDNPTFQSFPYQMRIEATETTAVSEPIIPTFKTEIGRYNLLGQEVAENAGGLQLVLFDDGTVEKVFVGKAK